MATPAETFMTWRGEIEGEIIEARALLAEREGALLEAKVALTAAIAERDALLFALAPLSAPVLDQKSRTNTVPQISTALGMRARDRDNVLRAAQSSVSQAESQVRHAREALADLELALIQLQQLALPANTESPIDAGAAL